MKSIYRPVILVPLDGSAEAERAISLAQALGSPGGETVLLRVVQGPEAFEEHWGGGRLTDEEMRASAEEVAQRYLAPLAATLRTNGFRVRTEVTTGDPAEEIIRLAEAEQVELVVMTTHGRGAAERRFFGSVADRVSRHSNRPTLLLRGSAPLTLPDRVVVPLDGSPLAEAALPVATWVAERLGALVHLVRVVDLDEVLREIWLGRHEDLLELPKDEAYNESRARCEQAAEAYLAGQVARLQALGISARGEVRTGTPAFVLLELLQAGDLGVMTTHGVGGIRRLWIGSVADKLVREASAPILIVRPGQATATGVPGGA